MIWSLLIKTVGSTVMSGIKHYGERKKVESKAELDWAASAQRASETSWKDEYLCILFTGLFVFHFIPPLQPYLIEGWTLLYTAPDWYSYCLLVIIAGSFGINIAKKFLK